MYDSGWKVVKGEKYDTSRKFESDNWESGYFKEY